MFKKTYLFLFGLLAYTVPLNAQDLYSWEAEVGFFVNNGNLIPLLQRINQSGVVPYKGQFAYFRGLGKKDYDNTNKYWDWSFQTEIHTNVGDPNAFFLPTAHIQGRYKKMQIYIGRKKEIFGLVDSINSIGSYTQSLNALPIPKIQLEIPEYVPLGKKKTIWFKGNYAHGWFARTDSVRNFYLHQKSIYIKLGRPEWKIAAHIGINHQVQWGGYPIEPKFDIKKKILITDFGNDPEAYFYAIVARSLTNNAAFTQDDETSSNDAGNRLGNHLGSVDIGLELLIHKAKLFLYRQSIYEDGSLFYLLNVGDGLTGLSLTREKKKLRHIVLELMNTSNQGGLYFEDSHPHLRGRDNYFNNSIYLDGWTYKGSIIGTPLMLTKTEYELNKDNAGVQLDSKIYKEVLYNRVKVFSVFFDYMPKPNDSKWSFSTRFLFLENEKTYAGSSYRQPSLSCFSILQSLNFHFKNNLRLKGNFTFDSGNVYGDNLGLNLSVLKSF